MKNIKLFAFLAILLFGTSHLANAQDKAAAEQKLKSQYALTKTTADKTDIVTAGAILVLKKDNLLMVDATSTNVFQNTYKDGKITQNALGKLSRFQGFHLPGVASAPSAPASGVAQRTFVAGEKMWVTDIAVKDNGITVTLFTDAINDVRYGADITFPTKGAPSADQAQKMVAEVFDVQPADDSSAGGQEQQAPANGQQQSASGGQQQQADAPPPPIAPPPPPVDAPAAAPKEVSLGQTKDLVEANFGQPDKIAKVGAKEIYYYKDFKVTFTNGKVTNVQ